MQQTAFGSTARKILILLLIVSGLIPALGGEEAVVGDAAIHIDPANQENQSGSQIDPSAWNHVPQKPSIAAGPVSSLPAVPCNYSSYAMDEDGDSLIYIFQWDDGNYSRRGPFGSGTWAAADHIWSRAGKYQVRVMAMDKNSSSPWSAPLTVLVNSPPSRPSMPEGQSLVQPGDIAPFSSSAQDPDGDQVRYIFDWGDGCTSSTNWTASGQAESLAHKWERAGSYEIRARALDGSNASSPWSESRTIIANTQPSRPDQLFGPACGFAMVPYCFQTSAIDKDGDFLNYTFDWGDGTADRVDLIGSGVNASSNHTWAGPGVYRIRAIALDRMGGDWSEDRNLTIEANEQPDRPRDLYGVRSGFTGSAYSYFTMTRDSDGDRVMYVLDWGDGTINETDYVGSGSLENASHIWRRPGEYPVRVGSIDEKGAPSRWCGPFLVAISANDPPELPAVPSGPAAGRCLISHKYATRAKDPDGDAVKYIFDWGDGITSWTGMGYLRSGEESAVSHKWMHPGVYKIKAAALDDKGLISNWSGDLLVKME